MVRAKAEGAELQPLGGHRSAPQAGPTHLNLKPAVNSGESADPNGLGVVLTVTGDASEKTFKPSKNGTDPL